MKELKDKTIKELADWTAGSLIVAIEEGDLRGRLIGILLAVSRTGKSFTKKRA